MDGISQRVLDRGLQQGMQVEPLRIMVVQMLVEDTVSEPAGLQDTASTCPEPACNRHAACRSSPFAAWSCAAVHAWLLLCWLLC